VRSTIKLLAFLSTLTACNWSDAIASDQLLGRIASTSKASASLHEYVVSPCRIRIANLFGGEFDIPYPDSRPPQQGIYHLPSTGPLRSPILYGGFSLNCVDADDKDKIADFLGAKKVGDAWLQPGYRNESWVPFDKQQHARIIELTGANWKGTGLTVDDTTGDERTRSRVFSFCLFHGSQALCGRTPVVFLANPKVNELWKVKAILQSIQFIENTVPTSVSAPISRTDSDK
jgi:hypothetical protein